MDFEADYFFDFDMNENSLYSAMDFEADYFFDLEVS